MNVYPFARPLLFRLDPETAHRLTINMLRYLPSFLPQMLPRARPDHAGVELMGLKFPNRLGMAAGLDKNGEALLGFDRLGFGHLEIGTITPKPQAGNPRPRLFRLPKEQAIINRMGFNNDGMETVCARIAKAKPHLRAIIGVNIGKNKITPNDEALNDYLLAFQEAQAVADYITINISSPNTEGLRDLQYGNALRELLAGLKLAQHHSAEKTGRHVPLVVKIAPDNSAESLKQIIDIIGESDIEGVITTNTTIDKSAVSHHPHASEAGGLSGAPLLEKSTEITAEVRRALPDIALIAAGGVMSADDMAKKFAAGADLVQLYSGLIFHGMKLLSDCLHKEKEIFPQKR